jgi:hypothetical protein
MDVHQKGIIRSAQAGHRRPQLFPNTELSSVGAKYWLMICSTDVYQKRNIRSAQAGHRWPQLFPNSELSSVGAIYR